MTGESNKKNSLIKKKFMVYLTTEQDEQLRILHEITKVPTAVRVRDGVDMVLEKHKDILERKVGNA